MSVWTPTAQRKKLALIYDCFRRSTSLSHMVDDTADVNHMLYFSGRTINRVHRALLAFGLPI